MSCSLLAVLSWDYREKTVRGAPPNSSNFESILVLAGDDAEVSLERTRRGHLQHLV
jgi:hypothetical protein